MKNELLLYAGVGLVSGSVIFGVPVGLAYILRTGIQEFKYGAFYSVFALVASIGYCLGSIAFYFNFLPGPPWGMQVFCSLISLSFAAGLVILALFVKKDNRVLFVLLSFYSLLTVWLAPVFIWNLIYLIFIARRSRKDPGQALPTTAG